MAKFRKKPVVIEARQLSRENGPELAAWCGGVWNSLYGRGDHGEDISHISIDTLEGRMRADLGDWIIRGVKGEFYPCKPDIFTATYESEENPLIPPETRRAAERIFDKFAEAHNRGVSPEPNNDSFRVACNLLRIAKPEGLADAGEQGTAKP